MKRKIKLRKLIIYFFCSWIIYFLFFLWEGGHFNMVTLSNASFLFALMLTIILTALWLRQERAFSAFSESCKRFFLKNYKPRDERGRNAKKKNPYLRYAWIISIFYYLISFTLLLFS
ncbi:DUF3899 domain-containing protein [Sporolactobacillus shoreae]|uniref:DUF3899 domain-containing protein n=1 Tax=Sporolactobacillus shoreae TaxID=1465501 RepID=A0A4Z0GRY7_9BACL|nr:DUF3899 domain-containing protein [Sporolactobacillus shoreae]TGA98975.1 DUF3899 domain-containing protein [Sporolactobacillus shoreae]